MLSTEAAAAFDDLTRGPGIKDESLEHVAELVPDAPLRARGRVHPGPAHPHAADARDGQAHVGVRRVPVADQQRKPSLTNLTGHPAVAVRAGFVANAPLMLMVTGRLYDEATMLRVALAHERGHEVE